MMITDASITNVEQVTPAWLTALLRARGVLPQGTVTAVHAGPPERTFASVVYRLTVEYSANAAASGAPRKLFLKLSNPGLLPGVFDPKNLQKEITFYRDIAPVIDAPFVIPCFHVASDVETGASDILLADVSGTHAACPAVEADLETCLLVADALAGLHGCWWDHPSLGSAVGRFPSEAERRQEWQAARSSTAAFLDVLGEQCLPAYRAVYQSVLDALPALFERHASQRNLTLAHGDAHLGNFLFPRPGVSSGAYILDWQFWHPTIGGTDLAFLMAVDWKPETRRAFELPVLRRYYDGLLARGVRGYTWDNCWDDYRLSVILVSIFIPVWRWSLFRWEPHMDALQSSMAAFVELGCSELLPV